MILLNCTFYVNKISFRTFTRFLANNSSTSILFDCEQMSTTSVLNNNKHKIAICQLTCTDDKAKNFQICKELVTSAKNDGAKVKFI